MSERRDGFINDQINQVSVICESRCDTAQKLGQNPEVIKGNEPVYMLNVSVVQYMTSACSCDAAAASSFGETLTI